MSCQSNNFYSSNTKDDSYESVKFSLNKNWWSTGDDCDWIAVFQQITDGATDLNCYRFATRFILWVHSLVYFTNNNSKPSLPSKALLAIYYVSTLSTKHK